MENYVLEICLLEGTCKSIYNQLETEIISHVDMKLLSVPFDLNMIGINDG